MHTVGAETQQMYRQAYNEFVIPSRGSMPLVEKGMLSTTQSRVAARVASPQSVMHIVPSALSETWRGTGR